MQTKANKRREFIANYSHCWATAEKIRCQEEVNRTNKTIELANRLVKGLEVRSYRAD